MQYAEHGSLLELIRKENFIPERKSRKIFQQLISAIEYCHSVGVVHR
jgi:testis-specific serine kinase